jgi:hypothetical protein
MNIVTALDKVQAVKEVQYKQIDQLVNYNVFSEFYSQGRLTKIEDYNHKCNDHNTKTSPLQPITVFSADLSNTCIIQSSLISIILVIFIFISMVFGILSSYAIIYGDTNTSYSSSYMLFHGAKYLDWFRTLVVL